MLLLVLAVPYPAIAQNPTNSDQAESDSKPTKSPWLALDYTGSLFGYYRIEPDEKDEQLKLNPPKKFDLKDGDKKLLLGMGDNFSPEFGASIERALKERDSAAENPCYLRIVLDNGKPEDKNEPPEVYKNSKNRAPEVLYKDSERLPNQAECDNVARFLMKAGYRAIVPGKEDFIYSAVWLRRIALALQAASYRVRNGRYLKDTNCPDDDKNRCLLFPDESQKTDEPNKSKVVKRNFADGHGMIKNNDHELLMLAANLRWNFTPRGGIEGSNSPSWFPKKGFSESVQKVCPLMFTWDPPRQNSKTCVPGGDQGNTGRWIDR